MREAAQLSDSTHGRTSEKRDPPIYALATFITANIERANLTPLLARSFARKTVPEGNNHNSPAIVSQIIKFLLLESVFGQ